MEWRGHCVGELVFVGIEVTVDACFSEIMEVKEGRVQGAELCALVKECRLG